MARPLRGFSVRALPIRFRKLKTPQLPDSGEARQKALCALLTRVPKERDCVPKERNHPSELADQQTPCSEQNYFASGKGATTD
jgi:hypothetical protein